MLRVRAIASASEATDGDAQIESGGGDAGVGENDGKRLIDEEEADAVDVDDGNATTLFDAFEEE